ncbi:MAG: ABC transporter ATP-binding protein [Sporolactobacillus sp.]
MNGVITLNKVNKIYGSHHVVNDLSLTINEGEFLTLLGPSGCGKTTTLRMIAGFEQPTDGDIYLKDKRVNDLPPYKRQVNTVFQNYELFPHLSVFANVGFGLKMKRIKKDEIKTRVSQMLSLVQLEGYENRKPGQLSGGQKQRVAIARSIINQPKVLLLDEPLSALDLKLRKQMQFELKLLQRKLNITFIYVTHDQEEAMTMSDRVAVMHNGKIEQLGYPRDIYERPQTRFVSDFIGESNLFNGDFDRRVNDEWLLHSKDGYFIIPANHKLENKKQVSISVRPENILLSESPVNGYSIAGTIIDNVFIGGFIRTIIRLENGKEIKKTTYSKADVFPVNKKVYIHWMKEDSIVLDADPSIY